MYWKYAELSAEQRSRINTPLPTDWTFGGEPGGRIWPVFVCPVCGEECDEDWGGCAHFKYVFEPATGRYACFNGTFFYELAAKLEAMGLNDLAAEIEDQVNQDQLLWPPEALGSGDGPTFSVWQMYPALITREFRVDAGPDSWRQVAAFVP